MSANDDHDWRVTVRPTATTLSPRRDTVVAFDLEGRPTSLFAGGDTFKRSLASELYGRRSEGGARRRWRVPCDRAADLLERSLTIAADARSAVQRGERLPGAAGAAAEAALAQRLDTVLGWTPDLLLDERRRFLDAYAPIAILPPDQYGAVVLQATFGCSWNRCSYCTFYQDRPFQVRPIAAFREHVGAVRDLLGRAAAGRTGIFLADGNALVLSNDRLQPIFDTATAAFPGRPVAGFVDVFSGERKTADDWRELRAWGLRRVAIGVETGSDALLAYLNKPGGASEAAAFVALLKEAGLDVSVILMVGVGGRRFAADHVQQSATLLTRLPLTGSDLIYLSPFVRQHDSAYADRAAADGLHDLTQAELAAQDRALRDAARAALPATKVARYHIDEFVY
ncbi:MAG: radical SAM protein [Trueperaceae bacterium]|nr:radical SAM protein [Trueperaceae bacterium]